MRPEDVLLMEPEAAEARLAREGWRVTLTRLDEPGASRDGNARPMWRVVRVRTLGREVQLQAAAFRPPKAADGP